MGIFFKILSLFKKNKPNIELEKDYSLLNELSSKLEKEIAELRRIQALITNEKIKAGSFSGKSTGGISFRKGSFIDEDFLGKLNKLAKISEKRFESLSSGISDPEEKNAIARVINLLKQVEKKLPDLREINQTNSEDDKLSKIEDAMREITEIAKKFYQEEVYGEYLAEKVRNSEISPLLKKIYQKPNKNELGMLYYEVSQKELNKLQAEAFYLNKHKDKNNQVIFRNWWKDVQVPETDVNTLTDPHINLIIKLSGKQKKIHLLIKAA